MNNQSQNITIVDSTFNRAIHGGKNHQYKISNGHKILSNFRRTKRRMKVVKKVNPVVLDKLYPCNSLEDLIDQEATYSTKHNKLLERTFDTEIPKRLVVGLPDSFVKISKEKEENNRNISKISQKFIRTNTKTVNQKATGSRPTSSSSSTYGSQNLNALSMLRRNTKNSKKDGREKVPISDGEISSLITTIRKRIENTKNE